MALRRSDLVLGALVVTSMAGNAVLFARWRAGPATPAPAAATAGPPAFAGDWRLPLPGLRASGAGPAPGSAPVALEACTLQEARLESQLAELDRLRDRHVPVAQRFGVAEPNRDLTAALATELARHPVPGGAGQVESECRGRFCRLVVPAAVRAGDWLARLNESEWVGQHLHEVGTDGDAILFEQHEPGTVRGSDLLQGALQDFEASGAVEQCQARFRGAGTLDTQVSLAPDGDADEPAGFSVQAGGALAGTQLGTCIDAEFRKALAAITLPPHFDRAELTAQFPRR
jgi:hypothetical protein